jgi:thiol-disulfide isomerase/thioredoxin
MIKTAGILFLRQIKKNWFTIFILMAFLFLLLSPGAKTILLGAFLKTGLFKADTAQTNTPVAFPENVFFLTANGEELHIKSLRGKVIFLNFWANRCPPCLAEMATIDGLHNKLKNDDQIRFILADTDDDLKKSLSVLKNNNYHLPVYGFTCVIPLSLSNGSIPMTLIIDPKGYIVKKFEGLTNYDTGDMLAYLRSLK